MTASERALLDEAYAAGAYDNAPKQVEGTVVPDAARHITEAMNRFVDAFMRSDGNLAQLRREALDAIEQYASDTPLSQDRLEMMALIEHLADDPRWRDGLHISRETATATPDCPS